MKGHDAGTSCMFCPTTFIGLDQIGDYRRHLNDVHPEGKGEFPCGLGVRTETGQGSKCKARFDSAAALDSHRSMMHGDYRCGVGDCEERRVALFGIERHRAKTHGMRRSARRPLSASQRGQLRGNMARGGATNWDGTAAMNRILALEGQVEDDL